MQVLSLDVDSLRAARLAREGVPLSRCSVPGAPCLPPRSALALGRFGLSSGMVNHGGLVSEPSPLGERRGFSGAPGYATLFQALRAAGGSPVSITPFPNRHVAPWFTLGLREWHNTGRGGFELAHEVNAVAEPWLEAHAQEDGWFLHANDWDAHTPYRVPDAYPNPFAHVPPPSWPSQQVMDAHWHSYSPNSAPYAPNVWAAQSPERSGIRHVDDHISRRLGILERAGVLEDTLAVVSADHGENQGELNVYGDYQTADEHTCRVPHGTRDLSAERPELMAHSLRVLDRFVFRGLSRSPLAHSFNPVQVRGHLSRSLAHLRQTGRATHAGALRRELRA